jgi:2-polyprenyl-3-methyl-5-hydroxy-6-metoxy-1,4-benzoquinol methylase
MLPAAITDRDDHIASYGRLYGNARTSQWKICGNCGFVHQNPRPSAEALDAFYMASEYRREREDHPIDKYRKFGHWYYGEKIDFVERHAGLRTGEVYDAGCGYGPALAAFADRGWTTHGVEADEYCVEYARTKLGLTGVQRGLLRADAEPAGRIDLVFSNHAFEHFANLDDAMRGVARLVKPGGYVFTCVPTWFANRSVLSRQWMNSGHYSVFTHRSLDQLFARHGFEPVAHTYRGWWKEIDEVWHLARKVDVAPAPEQFFEDPAAVSRYLRVINPLRSLVFYPVFDRWSQKRIALQKVSAAVHLLMRDPVRFARRASQVFGRRQ